MTEPILSSSVTLENRTLWFGKIELHEDQVVISGWTWRGVSEERIPLGDITSFEKWSVQKGPNFRLHFGQGHSVFGRIEQGIGFWAQELRRGERIKVTRRH